MNKDALFDDFVKRFEQGWSHMGCGAHSVIRNALREIIAPYLAIPRSLKDYPPKSGRVLMFKFGSDGTPYVGSLDCDACEIEYEIKTAGWLYWLPFPEFPQPDKDEQEFEEWEKSQTDYGQYINSLRKDGWMAARGRK